MARLNAKSFALISPAMLVLVACSGSTTPQADPEETVQVEDSLSEEAEVAQERFGPRRHILARLPGGADGARPREAHHSRLARTPTSTPGSGGT